MQIHIQAHTHNTCKYTHKRIHTHTSTRKYTYKHTHTSTRKYKYKYTHQLHANKHTRLVLQADTLEGDRETELVTPPSVEDTCTSLFPPAWNTKYPTTPDPKTHFQLTQDLQILQIILEYLAGPNLPVLYGSKAGWSHPSCSSRCASSQGSG